MLFQRSIFKEKQNICSILPLELIFSMKQKKYIRPSTTKHTTTDNEQICKNVEKDTKRMRKHAKFNRSPTALEGGKNLTEKTRLCFFGSHFNAQGFPNVAECLWAQTSLWAFPELDVCENGASTKHGDGKNVHMGTSAYWICMSNKKDVSMTDFERRLVLRISTRQITCYSTPGAT